MKNFIALLLCFLMVFSFAGCQKAPEETPMVSTTPTSTADSPQTEGPQDTSTPLPSPSLTLALEDYPVVDGSTANLPLMAAVLSRLTGISQEDAEALTSCSTTAYSYQALLDGRADLLLVYEPAEETRDLIEQSSVELEFIPIGRDALVFITNESNPVDSLTGEQLVDIYTGKITSWSEVGGEDMEILPFQRDATSGSQALFIKLVMQDTAPMTAPTELTPTEMGELIESLADYNNSGNALGYSVYYYASLMYAKPGLKFLAVDGVAPSDETIASGTYPYLNEFYAVIRTDEPEDSPARQIAAWLRTDEGKDLIASTGYIPLS